MALAKFLNIFALAFAKEAANLISIGAMFCGELAPNRVVRKIQIFQFHKLLNSLKIFISRDWHHDRNCVQQDANTKRA
jgi:hypothetical protein